MKNLDDIAKEHGIDNIVEADRYERGMSRKFTHEEWEVAHEIADDYEKRGQ